MKEDRADASLHETTFRDCRCTNHSAGPFRVDSGDKWGFI
jgi:hypothetical protein